MSNLSIVEMESDRAIQDAELEDQIEQAYKDLTEACREQFEASYALKLADENVASRAAEHYELFRQRRPEVSAQLEREKLAKVLGKVSR